MNVLPVVAAVSLQIGLSVMSVIAKYALDCGMSPRIFVAERLIVAATILTPLALVFERNTRPTMTANIFAQIVIMSFFEPLLEQNLYYTGMHLTTPTFTSGMFNLLPAITFVMVGESGYPQSPWKSKGAWDMCGGWGGDGDDVLERPTDSAALDQLVAPKKIHRLDGDMLRGGLVLVSSCLSWSFYVILQAKVIVSYPAKLSLTALICIIGAIGSTVTALIWERDEPKAWTINSDVTLLASLYGGCFSAITVYVVGWMAEKKGLVFVSIFNPINLIATAVIILSEQMFVGRIIGAFVIIIGISGVLWGKMGEQTSPPPPEHKGTTQDIADDV